MFGRSLVEDGPWQEDFDSTISVYAACGDAGRGNDYIEEDSSGIIINFLLMKHDRPMS